MIKIKVIENNAKAKVEGSWIDVVSEAGIVIWELKSILRKERLMTDEELKAYLTAFVMDDTQEDVVKFLNANMGKTEQA